MSDIIIWGRGGGRWLKLKNERRVRRCAVCWEAAESTRDIFCSSQLYPSFCKGKQRKQHGTYCFSFSAALCQIMVPSGSGDDSSPGERALGTGGRVRSPSPAPRDRLLQPAAELSEFSTYPSTLPMCCCQTL